MFQWQDLKAGSSTSGLASPWIIIHPEQLLSEAARTLLTEEFKVNVLPACPCPFYNHSTQPTAELMTVLRSSGPNVCFSYGSTNMTETDKKCSLVSHELETLDFD